MHVSIGVSPPSRSWSLSHGFFVPNLSDTESVQQAWRQASNPREEHPLRLIKTLPRPLGHATGKLGLSDG